MKKNKTVVVSNNLNGLSIRSDSIESIYPFVMKEERNMMIMGGNYVRVIAFTAYPDNVEGNWLSELKRIKGNVTISQHITPSSNFSMADYYNKAIKNKDAELKKTFDPKRQLELQNEIKSAQYQLEQTLNNKSGFVKLCTYVFFQATTEAELNKLETRIMMVVNKLHIRGLVPYTRLRDAFYSSLPIFENNLEDYTFSMTNTAAASSFFLYDDNELCDIVPGAMVEGYNDKTNSLIAINYNNRKKTLNRNMMVFGTSGSGKSTFLKHKFFEIIAKGSKVFIIDPENEFSSLVKYYGGEVVSLGTEDNGIQTIFNPFEFFSDNILSDEDTPDINILALVKQKIQRLKGFWKQIKNDISDVELSLLDKIINELFLDKGFASKDIYTLKHSDFPVMEDLYLAIEKMKISDPERFELLKDFFYILYSHVYGADALFNGFTNVDLKSQVICFNLSRLQLQKTVQGACYYNLFQFLWDEVINAHKKSLLNDDPEYEAYVVADEFHFLLSNEESCDFFFQAYKRFRKYSAGAIVSTQQIIDVLNAKFNSGKIGDAITQNSFTKVFFGFENKGVKEIMEQLSISLSSKEINLLKSKEQGKALIIYGNKRVFLNLKLNAEELRLLNPTKFQETFNKNALDEVDYISKIKITPIEKMEIDTLGGGR